MGELLVLDRTGDTKLVWNVENQQEIDAAREMFNSLKAKRYIAYRVDKKGEKASIMTEFDPTAECMIMSPPMAGG